MKRKLFSTVLGAAALCALVYWFNARSISADIVKALWILPAIIAWHLGQLFLSACAWRLIIGDVPVGRFAFFRLRIIRESMNSLLPTAQIGGPVLGAIGMAQLGVRTSLASAGTIADVILEGAAQLIFVLMGLLLIPGLILTNPDRLIKALLLVVAAALFFFVGAQLRAAQHATRALFRWLSFVPHGLRSLGQSLHSEWLQLKKRPLPLLKAIGLHLLSWCGGAGEVYLILLAIGVPIGLRDAFVIESIGTAARSAGFAIPGALGFQETGFILIGSQFGLEPDAALAVSIIKRLRELLIASLGLILWQFWGSLNAAKSR